MAAPRAPMLSTALTLGLLLSACGGNPIGERLAAGFDPPTPPASTTAPAAAPATPETEQTAETAPTPADPAPQTQPTQPVAQASPAPPVAGALPYRVTLQLSGVDPAAPAEAVTEALRKAGIRFEVETIERLPQAGPTGGTPATPPATAPAPATGPSPPPR